MHRRGQELLSDRSRGKVPRATFDGEHQQGRRPKAAARVKRVQGCWSGRAGWWFVRRGGSDEVDAEERGVFEQVNLEISVSVRRVDRLKSNVPYER